MQRDATQLTKGLGHRLPKRHKYRAGPHHMYKRCQWKQHTSHTSGLTVGKYWLVAVEYSGPYVKM